MYNTNSDSSVGTFVFTSLPYTTLNYVLVAQLRGKDKMVVFFMAWHDHIVNGVNANKPPPHLHEGGPLIKIYYVIVSYFILGN